jgi:phosphonate degradation associated HDIG domain protein
MHDLDALFRLYETRGHERYGEDVTQLQHALQCADLAERDGAPPALIAAALLHDVGHLLHRDAGAAYAARVDDRHERLGAAALARAFGPEVVRPVALHVEAKRWLCRVEPGYWDTLSDASKTTLRMQGDSMDAAEAAAFEADPHAEDAVRLRRWDEAAKAPEAATPGLAHYRELARTCRYGA